MTLKTKTSCLGAYVFCALALACAMPALAAAGVASQVNVFAGTRPGPHTFGGGHNFPGATTPFGMVQWSPDTTPADRNSGGYDYRDTHIDGFSLTHLSGAGCSLYGDFPFLPTTEPLYASPAAPGAGLEGIYEPGFSHSSESGRPGYYSVRLNPVHGGGIDTELTATTRSGMARFTFPRNPHSSVLINAGGSAQPDDFSSVQVNPAANEIDGTASSGLFCGQRPRYRVYFAAIFNRSFSDSGTWTRQLLDPESTEAQDSQTPATNPQQSAQAGAYATFDTTQNRTVLARVGISFVSVDDARQNLLQESGSSGFGSIAAAAQRRWNQSLERIRVSGGPSRNLRTFYTALYHAFIAPRTFDDVNGQYIGMDNQVHSADGRTQYADLSGWDIYRSEIPLLSILAPQRVEDIVKSMLADADQSGCLPRWSYANGQSMTMVGDPADPIIASASAFGARDFDSAAALAAMAKGATDPSCQTADGSYLERQGIADYQALGYVPLDIDTNIRNANSIYGDPADVWASASTSLEYNTDDFAIAQFAARARGDRATYDAFIKRSATWRRLFNRRHDLIEPRYSSGGFPTPYNDLQGGGFAEGNSYQYTWMVPHDPAALFRLMGGRAKAADKLDFFFRELNGSNGATHTSHALLGNEPNLNSPWLYDWTQRPYRAQATVRRALSTLYSTSPDGYPGNDDLGSMSSWYVFGALGLYPEIPGVGVLAISSPLFPRAAISLANGRRALITTQAFTFRRPKQPKKGRHHKRAKPRKVALTPAAAPYIRGVQFNGHAYGSPWTTYCALARGGRIAYQLGPRPDRDWGDSAASLPPSFGPHHTMPKNSCTP